MKLIISLLRNSTGLTMTAIGSGIIAGVSNTVLLGLVNLGMAEKGPAPASLIWGFVALCVVVSVSRFLSSDLLLRLTQKAPFDLRMKLSRRIVSAPLRQQEEIGAGRILAVLTEDIPAIANALVVIPTLCPNVVIVATCLLYLGTISWKLLLGVFVFIVVGLVTCQLPLVMATRYLKKSRSDADKLLKLFRYMTDGAKELKLNSKRRHSFLDDILAPTVTSLQKNNVVSNSIFTAVNTWAQTLLFILLGLLVFLPRTTIGLETASLMGFILVLLFMLAPLMMVVSVVPTISRANVALKKIDDLGLSLSSGQTETDCHSESTQRTPWIEIALAGVTHTYYNEKENATFTLGPLHLTFRPEEIVFITGGNGSGKTTLAKLLSGLYEPETGEVRFNGEPVTAENRDCYRCNFSAIFSDFCLFETLTATERPGLDEEARVYLSQLEIDHKVEIRNGELSTLDLSQGQRKRLALLTAYIEDRSIYLFDEWASDQEPRFREIFYEQILPELKKQSKTVIVITHDDRYYHLADRVIKLDYGKVTNDECLAMNRELAAEVH